MKALALLLLAACTQPPAQVEPKWGPADARAALAGFGSYDPKRPVDPKVLCPQYGLCEDVKPGEICMCPDRRARCRIDVETCCGYCDGQ